MTPKDASVSDQSSHREIARSSTIMVAATGLNLLIGLVRMKAAALLVGPSGVGTISLLQTTMTLGAAIAGLGIRTEATRQIAHATGNGDALALAHARRALFWTTALLAIAGTVAFWSLSAEIGNGLRMEVTQTSYFKLLAVGVCFSVISSSQAALLTGLRRIKDLALVNVASSCVSTLLGCAALAADATLGMIVFVLVGPISAALVGYLCARRLPKGDFRGSTSVLPSAVKLVRVGTGLMFTGLLAAGCELAQRVLIADAIGERSVGLFQAAWTVSMSYTSLLLNAMSADLYPRLASAANSPRTMRRLANEQAEMGILVGGPIFLLAIGLSPVLLEVLFSSEFYPAAGLLRLQAIGDLFKILAWPLGYLLLSGGANRQYIVAECGSLVCYLVTLFLLLPVLQLRAAGVAFICMYLVYLIVAYRAAHRLLGFEWDTRIKVQAALVVLAGSSCLVAAEESQWLCAVAGGFAATCFSLYSFRRLYALFRCPRPETPV